ncbi:MULTISPECIES: ABC transporter permease [unclassified Rathayibacter]|uniref:ABC transporter permease n=1 Tax=unclassified Rathayibacter TaxID=2609250 RepID=UPI001050FD8E|nr:MULTISPECIES: ABC transporter permease [unclassified Rathayibacter]MCJ1673972.1 ABC transporter permease [Rathayibacter sp. VKM Ac-2929]MCJ1683032.1 ABC transporter permease [Rathayibacter sp. VKM Ac-2928]MCJ1702644.1 ABC transporter permease [Rathayibacter sp. VKM Ac-2926]TCL85827.1 ribose transport system permease protein [Rathayibacter sp. PhB192]TCM31648.1 ribose transport system permease protein [Rathayibacter sp. PhB179]
MPKNTLDRPPASRRPDTSSFAAVTQRPTSAAGALARRVLPKSYLVLVLIAIIIAGYYVSADFLTLRNAENVIAAASIVAVLAVGQFFVVLTGGIDLSVGSTLALSTVVVALTLQSGLSAEASAAVTLLCCAGAGLINGLLIVWLRIPPFIATLATMSAIKGFSYIIQSTSLIQILDERFIDEFSRAEVLGVRSPVLIFVVVAILAGLVARFTTFGRSLYAIGGNPEAARLSGLPVARNLIITYTLSGLLAGLAGLIAAAQLRQGSSLIGVGYELDAIAAVVVGGASLMGGKGDPISAVIGVFVLATIINIMNLVGISSEPQLVIKGGVIILAVFLSSAGGVARIGAFVGKHAPRRRAARTA